ncbi:ATP-grasp domain-containing protein [Ramlibacter alkalitolerans]|uniref:ATP-grasp domain-containing protein n=1 Tax=Ramlibacter alkalitolerans TaxID=2039631 RepID=A0ABS1JLM4_9BURK|nr:ATP-grasp domain-containing protein [Ramlibacter alkalitolerans]MBL0424695.1 ATP-grasp domain-containing protein [Ramlibacter alkalitolerans]
MAATVVVAGLSARVLAESARQAGWQVIALDLFGDADTRRAGLRWHRIGDPGTCTIEPALLRHALHLAAGERGAIGWVAGSGFEAAPELLQARIPGLPFLGMAGAALRAVREPASFFGRLDRLGLPHPEVAFEPPASPEGWLAKSAAGCGGWHIRPAREGASGPPVYWQRVHPGEPMSALFLADGAQARLVALNRLIVRPLGALPYVYAGAVGPVHDAALARELEQALAALVPAFGLRGLASLDFLAHAGRAWLLEINARPSATMALHGDTWPDGLLQAHVQALAGALPAAAPAHPAGVRGCLTVFAGRECRVGLSLAAELAQSPACHDLPPPGLRFGPGEPVCTVSAAAADEDAVLAGLEARARGVLRRLSPCEELVA